ncbi:hypothetical protein [Bosea sp. (in: a-proteobacteria)]|uniref:hypothetical protein n=1 Tax=Bosea sp. (in: a-proteobacteria) TaxID=1871050 RepID=UPI004033FB20
MNVLITVINQWLVLGLGVGVGLWGVHKARQLQEALVFGQGFEEEIDVAASPAHAHLPLSLSELLDPSRLQFPKQTQRHWPPCFTTRSKVLKILPPYLLL